MFWLHIQHYIQTNLLKISQIKFLFFIVFSKLCFPVPYYA